MVGWHHQLNGHEFEEPLGVGGGQGSNGTPLQYSCLENPMNGGAWWAAVHGVAKSHRPATPLFSPACWEPGFQAWAQSPCPELPAQGLGPLRWGCALPNPNAPGKAPSHIHTWGFSPEARRGSQGASRAAPGKSGLHFSMIQRMLAI